MQASIAVDLQPAVQYLLRIGDTCLIHAQRIAQFLCGLRSVHRQPLTGRKA